FGPEVTRFLESRNLPAKAVLLLDNAPVHPIDLKYPGIEVVFMPPNTSCLLQPMDQTVIKTFKSYYMRNLLRDPYMPRGPNGKVRGVASKEEYDTYWRKMKIDKCIEHVDRAWEEVKGSTLHRSWKKVWPSLFCSESFQDGEDTVEFTEDEIEAGKSLEN